jgi:sec-independent protein translocase protein TatC
MALDQEFEQELDETEGKEMSFLDHLEELRWHIIRSVASILVFTIVVKFLEALFWLLQNQLFGQTECSVNWLI